jgi:uncharacterized damage-inducible protein DinB
VNPSPGTASSTGTEFIDSSRALISRDYLPKLQRFLEDVSDETLWWRPNEASNSIGNLILHLCGNLRQWIVSPAGHERDRPAEFAARGGFTKGELLARFETVAGEVDRALADLAEDALLERITVQDFQVTRLQAVYHALEHCGYHLGQIGYIVKLRTGRDFGLFP